jgi:hypothetical protein
MLKKPHDNQAKRVGKLACQGASEDCSSVARRKTSGVHSTKRNACTEQEQLPAVHKDFRQFNKKIKVLSRCGVPRLATRGDNTFLYLFSP